MRSYKVHWSKIYPHFVFHAGYYDHPLNGVVRLNGQWWWFDWEYQAGRVMIREMSQAEAWRKWWKHTRFGLMVGWHTHYQNGSRRTRYGTRKPRWFWRRVASVYYHGWRRGIMRPMP